jgi:hypothetical protein
MRTKPVTREEVRVEGAWLSHFRIITLPRNTVREDTLEAIPELWGPLLQELNRAAAEWSESPKGLAGRRVWLELEGSDVLKPVTMPKPARHLGCPACRRCGRRFYRVATTKHALGSIYCSDRCQRLANAPARKMRQAVYVEMRSLKREKARNRKCAHCGEPIEAQRLTMRFCSTKCRVAAHRKRNATGQC